MKKKLTALLLAVVLCFAFMPSMTVFASQNLNEGIDGGKAPASTEKTQEDKENADNSLQSREKNEISSQQANIYYVNNLEDFQNAIDTIENDNQFAKYEIHLNSDIVYGDVGDSIIINKDVTIFGHGHTLNLGTKLNFNSIDIMGGC